MKSTQVFVHEAPGDLSYVMVEGEVIIKDDSKVAAVGGWRQGGVVDGEAETDINSSGN